VDVITETFERDVIERSYQLPVSGPPGADPAAPSALRSKPRPQSVPADLPLAKIDVEAEPLLAARYGVQSIPTVVVFRDGEPVTGFVGAHPASAIGRFLDELVEAHDAPALVG